jgi:hypothetical protein
MKLTNFYLGYQEEKNGNEKEYIPSDTKEIQRIISEYYEQL